MTLGDVSCHQVRPAFPVCSVSSVISSLESEESFLHHQLKTEGPKKTDEDSISERWRETKANPVDLSCDCTGSRVPGCAGRVES